MAVLVTASVLLACEFSSGQDADGNSNTYVVKTSGRIAVSHEGIGDELSAKVSKAAELISRNQFEESGKLLDEALKEFHALMNDTSRTYVCFNLDKDFKDYMKELEAQKGKQAADTVVRVSAAFGLALQMKAFIASDMKQWKAALEYLDTKIQYCPYDIGVLTEKAYILHSQSMNAEALAIYKKAVEIGAARDAEVSDQAVALRGMGSTLIDLDKLDEAESYYKKSLELDPNSKLAHDELEYIKQARAAKKAGGK